MGYWYSKGQSQYTAGNFHMAYYIDMDGYDEVNYDSQDIEGDGESGDPFMSFGINTTTWAYGQAQVEIGLLASNRIIITDTEVALQSGYDPTGKSDSSIATKKYVDDKPGGGATQLSELTDVGTVAYESGKVLRADGDNYESSFLYWNDVASKPTTFVYTGQANTYSAGMKQKMQANATTAGLSMGGYAGNPSTLTAGDLWYNTSTNRMMYRGSSASRELVAKELTQILKNKTINATDNTITDTSTASGDLLKSNGTKFVRLARGTDTYVLKSSSTDIAWGQVSWSEVQSKPTEFTPIVHDNTYHNPDFCVDDDARLSDARTPTIHALDSATYHTINANTTFNASVDKHGFLKQLCGSAASYMDGTGNWSVPVGSGSYTDDNARAACGMSGVGEFNQAVQMVSHQIKGLSNGTLSTDAMALGQKYTNAEAVAAVLAADDYVKNTTDTMSGALTVGGLLTADCVNPEADLADDLGTASLTWRRLYCNDLYDSGGYNVISFNGAGVIDVLGNLSCNIVFSGAQTVDGVDISAISITNMPAAVNNWKMYYTNGSGVMTEIATGAAGKVLTGNGVDAAPSFQDPAGSGDPVTLDIAFDNGKIIDGADSEANAVQIGNATQELLFWVESGQAYIKSDRSINIIPTGETDDYIKMSVPAGVPTIGVIGGNNLYISESSVWQIIHADDFTPHSAPLPIENSTEKILAIKNNDLGKLDYQSIPSDAYYSEPDGKNEGYKMNKMMLHLIKTIQELEARIKVLEEK